jgi:protein O-mannosyl-transferase
VDLMKISAEEFVGRLAERPPHTQHALLLGAGCSVTSGIPAAGALVAKTWLPRLYRYRGTDGESLEDWAVRAFSGYDPSAPALSYGPVMEALFPLKHDKQKEVERICRDHDPGFGCCVLAKLIERASPDLNVILTTNFDDLIADALYLFTASRPLVIPHAALAGFMRADFERPLVVKLHGDHQLEPLNTKEELAALNAVVRERLQSLLQQRGLIVMGYAGNDDSVMDALEALPGDTLGPGVWWVARSTPNDRVLEWLSARKGYWVESADFDQLMLLVQQRFGLPHPEIARWEQLQTNYFEAFSTLRTAVEKLPESEPSAAALKEASAQSVERIPDWWQVELRARPLKGADPDAADAIYRDGLERIPSSAELLGNYAVFLDEVRKDDEAAESFYKRAIDADSTNAKVLGNYALFLHEVREEFDAAEDFYKRAIDADPSDAKVLGNYALLLDELRKDDEAVEGFYKRAIDADPTNAINIGNYARHLIHTNRIAEGIANAERALELADDTSQLLLELWFYLYANGPEERRQTALSEEKRLLTAGARSPGWDLSGSVSRAEEHHHPEAEWLPRLASVLADEAAIDVLDDWGAWNAA